MPRRVTSPLLLVLLLALPLLAVVAPLDSGDLWWHLAYGHQILEEGSLPATELFSHTMQGERFIPQEWGTEVILAATEATLGLAGIRALAALLVLAGGCLIWSRSRSAGLDLGGRALILGLWSSWVLLLAEPRPHLFTFVLFLLFDRLVIQARVLTWKRLGAAFLLTMLWANLHAVALLAPIYAAAAAIGASFSAEPDRPSARRLWSAAGLALLATFCTPIGPALHEYALFHRSTPAAIIDEWQPFWRSGTGLQAIDPMIALATVGGLLLGLVSLIPRRGRPIHRDLLASFGSVVLALSARRWLWLLYFPAIEGLARLRPRLGRVGVASGLMLAWLPLLTSPRLERNLLPGTWSLDGEAQSTSRAILPVGAADFLSETGLEVDLYHPYSWGGYLLYRLAPSCRVFLYGETVVFGEAILQRQRIEAEDETKAEYLLRQHGVDALVLPRFGADGQPTRPPLGAGKDGPWLLAFANFREAVWLRRSDRNSVARVAAYYDALGIPWNPSSGYLEGEALRKNRAWCRAHEVLSREELHTMQR